MCGHNFVIIDCDRMYCDRFKGKRHRRAHHLRGCWRTGRDSDIYQYQCGDRNFSEYRNIPSVCKLWTDIPCLLFAGIGLVLNVGLQPKNINRGDESV